MRASNGSCHVVHVIDDDPALRDSLDFLLGSAGFAVRLFDSAEAFLHALPSIGGGCVITDVRMQGLDGLEVARRLGAGKHAIPVIVITGHGDVPLAVKAMKLGATDFIEKPFDGDVLIAAVRAAIEKDGQTHAADAMTEEMSARLATLSHRETEVLSGLMYGKTNKEIAREHGLSARTVEVYRAKLMAKMKADSVSELVRFAIKAGFAALEPEPPERL
ncbi:response regulator FixJ [Methylocapsa acidiphila]|uniref:response regulator FixJ n=1 Tax=Methylocapsa acidiphila TaxID=133552 RepID=UPI00047C4FEA|nr:response regulator FixJ [Methylocapsa acidiphila]